MKLLYRNTPGRPVTQINLVFPRSGACLDRPDRQGLSRYTLRLMLMGAGGMSTEELNGRLERLGASTGFSLANDHFTLRLISLSENLEAAWELFLLSLHQPKFDPGEFAQLQAELVSAWVAERDESKQTRAHEVYLHRMYGGGPQGYLSDGMLQGLRAITLDDVKSHYRTLFSGDAPLMAVLSDLPQGSLESQVVSRLTLPDGNRREAADGAVGSGAVGNGANGIYPWDDFSPPRRSGRRITIVSDESAQTDEMMMGFFSTHQKDPDWHLHQLISLIFGGDMNSRLFRVVRGERGLSYGASCWYDANSGRVPRNLPAPFSFYSFPSVEHSAEAAPLLVSLYEEFVREGPSGDELTLARESLINSHPFRMDIPEKQLSLELQEVLYGVTTADYEDYRRNMEAVTLEDIRGALAKSHRPEALEIVMLGDPSRLEPIAEKISNVEKIETIHYP
ncbi:MAG: pitrilysin family protein [bacterium]